MPIESREDLKPASAERKKEKVAVFMTTNSGLTGPMAKSTRSDHIQ
jgi:hypothetical protein